MGVECGNELYAWDGRRAVYVVSSIYKIIIDVCCCHPQSWVKCWDVCHKCIALVKKHLCFVTCRWVTNRDSLAPEDPCFFCDVCFRMLHYDAEGNKLGEFLAYPYVDPGIFNWNWHVPGWIQWTTFLNLLLWLLKPLDSLSFEHTAGFWVRHVILSMRWREPFSLEVYLVSFSE